MKYIFGTLIAALLVLGSFAYYYEIEEDRRLENYAELKKWEKKYSYPDPFDYSVLELNLNSSITEIKSLYSNVVITELGEEVLKGHFSSEEWKIIKNEYKPQIPNPWMYLLTIDIKNNTIADLNLVQNLKNKAFRQEADFLTVLMDNKQTILAINRYKSISSPVNQKLIEDKYKEKYGKYKTGYLNDNTLCWGEACEVDDVFSKKGASLTLVRDQFPAKNLNNFSRGELVTEEDAEIFFYTTKFINHDATNNQIKPFLQFLNNKIKKLKEQEQKEENKKSDFKL